MDAVTKNRIRTAGIYIPLLSGTLSVIGSGSILYSIWARRHTKMKDPQHRILGMMSIFDILYSTNKAFMFLTYPSGLGVPTFGNDATCALQGFFTQMGYAGGTYNLVLRVYYYLIINKGMKKEDFAKVWEKVLHGIVVTCHVSFAIIGLSIGLFNPTPGFCVTLLLDRMGARLTRTFHVASSTLLRTFMRRSLRAGSKWPLWALL